MMKTTGSAISRGPTLMCALLLPCLLGSCRSNRSHFDEGVWRGSFEQFARRSDQWVPVAVGFAATPLLFAVDKTTSIESVEDRYFNSNTKYGDQLSLGLGFGPFVLGAAEGLFTGDTRHLEATSEAIALTAAGTQLLKFTTNRHRPDGSSGGDSFPSGHTSFAFAGATLFARWWEDEHEGSMLGYSLYLPAAYVGVTRLEGNRHYLSDIVFGAALGILTSHLVWNAHFGDETHEGLFGRRTSTRVEPVIGDGQLGLSFTVAF